MAHRTVKRIDWFVEEIEGDLCFAGVGKAYYEIDVTDLFALYQVTEEEKEEIVERLKENPIFESIAYRIEAPRWWQIFMRYKCFICLHVKPQGFSVP